MRSLFYHPWLRRHLRRGLKFAVAGGLGAVIDFSLFNLLHIALAIDPRLANVFSTFVASVAVFAINKTFAFRDRRGKAHRQAMKFLFVYTLAYILNVGLTALFITASVHALPAVPIALLSNLCKVVAIGLVMFWNYFLLHSFVFRNISPAVNG